MILSVHIPKTAGVSVRNILKEHYGPGFVLHYWQITDAWGRVLEQVPDNAACVHGHYHTDALTGRFPSATLITWVRDPVDRVVSSYFHRLRDPDWQHPVCVELHEKKLSLVQYAALPLVRNEMTRYFGSKQPGDFAFIGIVEDFERSLVVMKQVLGMPDIPARRDNVNPDKPAGGYVLGAQIREEIAAHNAEDVSLYAQCMRLWRERSAALAGSIPR